MNPLPMPDRLPPLDPDSQAHAEAVARYLRRRIDAAGGWLSFEDFMDQALYAPGLGYYAAGSRKLAGGADLAPAGDFVTAPELTPLFGATLARQVAQVLAGCGGADVLEFGAGTGALAESVLDACDALGLRVSYQIIEVSADLRERQQARLARRGERVRWLDRLPESFRGCVLANEVLDAMPVRLFRWGETALLERGVAWSGDRFAWADRPAPAGLAGMVAARMPPLPGYVSEINPRAEAFVRGMGQWLEAGAALLIDYGFGRSEYYHPQRLEGTLMCHLRHVAHADPLVAVGVQDITAHVDFTAMAEAALEGGLEVLGYAAQASFLMNAGLAELLAAADPSDARGHARAVAPVQKLLSPAEMGELFKVLAVGRGLSQPLIGFARGDRRHAL
ncbi:SAM-dependent methyltransferase [Pigmentiphaga soli]|uniref:SAM-dependent methyltransferase n=1 Tax=Pigmentiphaga soli TaxID=1007095 RepID=A0ABP8GHL9_9BURK